MTPLVAPAPAALDTLVLGLDGPHPGAVAEEVLRDLEAFGAIIDGPRPVRDRLSALALVVASQRFCGHVGREDGEGWLAKLEELRRLARADEAAQRAAFELATATFGILPWATWERIVSEPGPNLGLEIRRLAMLAVADVTRGDRAQAKLRLARAHELARDVTGLPLATLLGTEAELKVAEHDFGGARSLLRRAVAAAPDAARETSVAYVVLGRLEATVGDRDRSRAAFEAAIEHAERGKLRHPASYARTSLGMVEIDAGDPDRAIEILRPEAAAHEAAGRAGWWAATTGSLAFAELLRGAPEAAEVHYQALAEGPEWGQRAGRLGLVLCDAIQGHRAAALRRLAAEPSTSSNAWNARFEAMMIALARWILAETDDVAAIEAQASFVAEARWALALMPSLAEVRAGHVRARDDETLSVHPEGNWFQVPGGAFTPCDRFGPMRRLVSCLVRAHLETPGVPVTAERLIAVIWAGEIVVPKAARNRLHNLVSRLRDMGFVEILSSRAGYCLRPTLQVRVQSRPPEPAREPLVPPSGTRRHVAAVDEFAAAGGR
jgi:tetratricopeptide (TPR) repeat protein